MHSIYKILSVSTYFLFCYIIEGKIINIFCLNLDIFYGHENCENISIQKIDSMSFVKKVSQKLIANVRRSVLYHDRL